MSLPSAKNIGMHSRCFKKTIEKKLKLTLVNYVNIH